jgi:hypothetical protein
LRADTEHLTTLRDGAQDRLHLHLTDGGCVHAFQPF